MKKLLFSCCILVISFPSFSKTKLDGKYEVTSSPCSIFFLGKDGGSISRYFDVGEKLDLKTDKRFVSSSSMYTNLFITGLKEISYTQQSSFDRQYKKNSSLRWFIRSNEVKVVQTIKSFKYRVYRDFCNPYDFSGLSCAVGLMNPRNWVSVKKTYPETKIINSLILNKKGILTIVRRKKRKDSQKIFQRCELKKIN